MEIDLSRVIAYSKDSLHSRTLMRSIILDLYPTKTREMNVLLAVCESGILSELMNKVQLTNEQYTVYVNKLMDEYGIQEALAEEGISAWIDYCISPGYSNRLKLLNKIEKEHFFESQVYYDGCTTYKKTVANVSGKDSEYSVKVLSDGTLEIEKFLGFDTDEMIVPNCINGRNVTAIGKEAYKGCKKINKLLIAEGIETIGDGAFSNCESLKDVELPSTLLKIGSGANREINGVFQNTSLTEIIIPDNVRYIARITFMCCKKLKRVVLPQNLDMICEKTFLLCTSLEDIVMPRNLKHIGTGAFAKCTSLRKVTLYEGVCTIGDEAFSDCNQLIDINMPSSIQYIKKKAFKNCSSLKEIILNEGLKSIEDEAFFGCWGISKMVFPRTLNVIGNNIVVVPKKEAIIYVFVGSKSMEYFRTLGYNIQNADMLM